MKIKFNWEEKPDCLKCELGEFEMFVRVYDESYYEFFIYICDMLVRNERRFLRESVAVAACELEVRQIIESILLTVKQFENEH